MKKSALLFLLLTGLYKDALCVLYGQHIFIPIRQTWAEAREYCREYYTDLSSINSEDEDKKLSEHLEMGWRGNAWIGLYKDGDSQWKWSGGEKTVYSNWMEPVNTSESNRCAVQSKKGWLTVNCEAETYYFHCFQSNLVLVKEKKTWEEALNYCRHLFTDLVSLPSESALLQTLQTTKGAQTDYVWTGLRYLSDVWLWVDGQSLDYQAWDKGEMLWCPAQRRRCGALSLEGQHWDSRDCVDKLNFICYYNY